MRQSDLRSKFEDYCKALNLKEMRSHFLETPTVEDRKYICATPGTIFLAKADPRAGNLWAIMKNGERGTVSPVYGYANIYQIYGYMDGIIEQK